MALFVIGLNHTTAPLSLRERIAFAPSELNHALPELQNSLNDLHDTQANQPPAQLAVLSTCNRMEVYLSYAHEHTHPEHAILQWLATYHDVPLSELSEHMYILQGESALNHAFAVASGMNSMVLGEPQILGQMKQAARIAFEANTMGSDLRHWFEKSFAVAKDVRTNTAIGEHSVSMAAAAVKLAKRVFEDFNRLHVLLVGAGEMMDVVAAHIVGAQPKSLTVANRSLARAQALLAAHPTPNAQAIRLTELPEQLARFDVVVTCTASTLPIIGLGMVESAIKARRRRPVVMVDLGVPRDIEAAVSELDDAYVYTVDDLSNIVAHNSAQRTAALADAQKIVQAQVQQFIEEQKRRTHRPRVLNLRARAERVRQNELERILGSLNSLQERGELSSDTHKTLQNLCAQLSQRLTNKLLHEPTIGVQNPDENVRQAWQLVSNHWLNDANTEPSNDTPANNDNGEH